MLLNDLVSRHRQREGGGERGRERETTAVKAVCTMNLEQRLTQSGPPGGVNELISLRINGGRKALDELMTSEEEKEKERRRRRIICLGERKSHCGEPDLWRFPRDERCLSAAERRERRGEVGP